MSYLEILKLVEREDMIKFAYAYVSDFAMEHLWYPKAQEFTPLGLYCLTHNR